MAHQIGPYPIVRKIGEGGMGRIYLVRDTADGSLWAAKQYKGDLTRPLFVQRFRREFRALKSLDHPAIVRVRNLEYSESLMFFLMEYISGRSFDRVLSQPREYGPDWINQVLQWIQYLCDPLDYIHKHRMVHRDLKPGNIMIMGPDSDPPVKLLDFGVIHWMHADAVSTATPTFLGSLRYMAPEQMNNAGVDLRTDLYSLGIILYEAITGRPPFVVDNPLLLMNLHQTADPPPPQQFNLHVTENLQNLILTLLAKRPDDRPSSALEVSDWIQKILDGDAFVPPDPRGSVFMTGMLFTPEVCGREPELQKLRKAYQKSVNGELQVVTIHGATGIGKSRLLTQFQRVPDLAQSVVCYGEFQSEGPLHNGFSYALKRGSIGMRKRQMMQPHSIPSEKYDAMIAEFKSVEELLKGSRVTPDEPMNIKELAAGILQLLEKVSGNGPKLLILDDLQTAKPGDINLLKHIIQLQGIQESAADSRGLLIVLGYRDDIRPNTDVFTTFLNWLEDRNEGVDISLKGLDKIAVNRMVTSMLGGVPAPILAKTVYEDSDGNPLHIIELLRELIENQPDPVWHQYDGSEETLAMPSPARITQIMGRRIDRFSESVRDVLNAGAVLGQWFRADELEMLCDINDEQFLDQVDMLLRQRVIEEDPFQAETYRFTHLKLQEAVVRKITRRETLALHKKAVHVLETLHSRDLKPVAARLLRHAEACSLEDKVFEYSVLASEHADSLGDQIDALEHINRALHLLTELPVDETEKQQQYITLNISRASLLRRTGDSIQSEELLLKIQPDADTYQDCRLAARIKKQLGVLWGQQGKLDRAVPILEKSIDMFQSVDETTHLIDCYINLGASYNQSHETELGQKYLRIALEKAQLEGDEYRIAIALINLGISHASKWEGRDAIPYFERALKISEKHQYRRLIPFSLNGLASAYVSPELIDDNAEKVIDLTSRVIDLVKTTGDVSALLDSLYKRSIAKHHLGRLDISDLDHAISLAEQMGQQRTASVIIQFRESVAQEQNDM